MRMGMAIGGVALLGVAGLIAFGGAGDYIDGLFSGPTTINTTDTVSGVRDIAADNNSGNLTVRGADVATTVARTVRYYGDKPGQTFHSDGSTLTLAGCGARCSVDYVVTVPKATMVSGTVTSGDARVTGVGSVHLTATSRQVFLGQVADVGIKAVSGDVTVNGASGPVKVDATSGKVQLNGVGGDATVDAQSADIYSTNTRSKIDMQAQSGDIDINTAVAADIKAIAHSGNINVRVPKGAQYRVDAHAQNGDVQAIPDIANAPFQIDADADSGAVHIDQL